MPVSASLAAERHARFQDRMEKAKAVIPSGPYCYTRNPDRSIKLCPYWKARKDWPEQGFGYCRLLKRGDRTNGLDRYGRPRATMLLWDQVKECGLNNNDDPLE